MHGTVVVNRTPARWGDDKGRGYNQKPSESVMASIASSENLTALGKGGPISRGAGIGAGCRGIKNTRRDLAKNFPERAV